MGEIADMMLDGTMCEACGEFIDDGGAAGFPRYCSPQCAGDRGADWHEPEEAWAFRPRKRSHRGKGGASKKRPPFRVTGAHSLPVLERVIERKTYTTVEVEKLQGGGRIYHMTCVGRPVMRVWLSAEGLKEAWGREVAHIIVTYRRDA